MATLFAARTTKWLNVKQRGSSRGVRLGEAQARYPTGGGRPREAAPSGIALVFRSDDCLTCFEGFHVQSRARTGQGESGGGFLPSQRDSLGSALGSLGSEAEEIARVQASSIVAQFDSGG